MIPKEQLNREYKKAIRRNDRLANEIAIRVVKGTKLPPKLLEDYKAQRVIIHDMIDRGATLSGGGTKNE